MAMPNQWWKEPDMGGQSGCAAARTWRSACATLCAPPDAVEDAWQLVLKAAPSDQVWHSLRNCVAYQAGVWQNLVAKGIIDVIQPAAFKLAIVLRHTPSQLTVKILAELLRMHPQCQDLTAYVLSLLTDDEAVWCGSCGSKSRPTPRAPERDAKLFGDCELSVLAASREEYDAHAKLVRAEYSKLSRTKYVELRIKVLKQLSKIPKLYHSPEFENLESAARENIEREVSTLLDHLPADSTVTLEPRAPSPAPSTESTATSAASSSPSSASTATTAASPAHSTTAPSPARSTAPSPAPSTASTATTAASPAPSTASPAPSAANAAPSPAPSNANTGSPAHSTTTTSSSPDTTAPSPDTSNLNIAPSPVPSPAASPAASPALSPMPSPAPSTATITSSPAHSSSNTAPSPAPSTALLVSSPAPSATTAPSPAPSAAAMPSPAPSTIAVPSPAPSSTTSSSSQSSAPSPAPSVRED